MSNRSLTLAEKLNSRFAPDRDLQEATDLLLKATSGFGFHSLDEFKDSLVEGTLLNVSVIASRALSVPQGEYLVWMTDAGHTMLVPTSERKTDGGVYEHSTDAYEVQTKDLMANWNRIERTIAENTNFNQDGNLQEPEGEEGDEEEGKAGQFTSTIDVSTVDRTPIMQAMHDRGYTVTSLADEVGVDPPAISRILRTPKDRQGDPGGRNPSMGLASQICNTLRIDPTSAFPDIFNVTDKHQARQTPGNSGSGSDSGGRGKGATNLPESVSLSDSIVLLEANQNYQILCRMIAESGVPFNTFWQKVFIPTVLRSGPRSNAATLTESLINEWPWSKRPAPQSGARNPFSVPGSSPTFNPKQSSYDSAVGKMNAKILPGIKQAFQKAMGTLKQDLQNVQTAAGADPKTAPHAWKAVDQFYKNIVKSGEAWTPKWQAQPKGSGNSYDTAYQKAATDFQASQNPAAGFGADPLAAQPASNPAMGGGALANNNMGLAGAGGDDDVIDAEYEVKQRAPQLAGRANPALRGRQQYPAIGGGSAA